ncbi:carboxypeptidase-like regulatory domain-containing protein [Aquimarina longa]|uniref:carboxypeptidase-like regulatory domain-containing protein n=1 Tax=Aquimarina longa TaxID=1080221 RepID=UPI000780AA79|nr:carboxypeptidase-like regulatory domain-containing protein [Aquimarina longa]
MKTKIAVLFLFLVFNIAAGQITSRIILNGKINVPIGDDVEGIVVYNRSTNKGTITDKTGNFKISAGINDRVEVVAMQYQHFVILIDKGILRNRRLHVFLNESINQLDEVVVTPYDLLGNVRVDVKKIGYRENGIGDVAEETSSIINDADYNFRPDELSIIKSNAFEENRIINGLNFVNLFKLVYDTKDDTKKKNHPADIDVRVRDMYNDQFFKDYLALEINQINDFIFFAEDNGLNYDYFKPGKELDLLQFLAYQSKLYHKKVSTD